ncbi:MAG: BMP family protein [Comamonas sp.]|uniref:BMP family protein n=1 Tax=Comamonas sp. TaxID=34028 RepID=UPI002648A0F3|nr:BMP family protein [Comamonas sp.]MDN5505786.1 BMP family protein [Comamonas sp.]MDN5538101.1 BMP family protein [Comamonas sp.]
MSSASHPSSVSRRQWMASAIAVPGLLALTACAGKAQAPGAAAAGSSLVVGGLFAGSRSDKGFMEAGWRGLEKARQELGVQTRFLDGVAPRKELLVPALAQLAEQGAQLVIAHGGQNNQAAAEVAARFPRTQFVVTQGAVQGSNLCSYDVLQEESAYLAGVLAALTTKTGVVGHMSGIRVPPGLKGRAAYAAGVRDTDSRVKLLTNFSGDQDDNALSLRIAKAQMAAGADVIFTMLNSGRDGVTQACREAGTRQIGNVIDWTAVDPQVFVASAWADVGIGAFLAVKDMQQRGAPGPGIRKIGLSDPAAVRLTMGQGVAAAVRERVAKASAAIASGQLKVTEHYEGPEFAA